MRAWRVTRLGASFPTERGALLLNGLRLEEAPGGDGAPLTFTTAADTAAAAAAAAAKGRRRVGSASQVCHTALARATRDEAP
jgi:hypothetical protein